uniref:Uncharacterized protein n=1 Tax=Arundo donax TaxID=35708 RepID=A0A0A8Y8Q1_ARUDO
MQPRSIATRWPLSCAFRCVSGEERERGEQMVPSPPRRIRGSGAPRPRLLP